MNSILTLYICLSVTLSRINRCTNINEFLHEGTIIFEEGYRLFFTTITNLQQVNSLAKVSKFLDSKHITLFLTQLDKSKLPVM